jgi:hypothetical protein
MDDPLNCQLSEGSAGQMRSRNLSRRLERLEAQLTPSEERVLTIVVSRIGEPDRTIEVRGKPADRRRPPWRRNGGRNR